jgi:molybdopterin-guanine dinucleotide biosynthesis protein B
MKAVAFTGYSGAGKTTLVTQLVTLMRTQGLRVSVVKHARHGFDIDTPGKDTYRHRQAGAFEVLVASSQRLALMREFEQPCELTVHQLMANLYDGVDWVLVEGFRDCDMHKVEVWRAATGHPVCYGADAYICAIATDSPAALPLPTGLPLLDLNDAPAVLAWLLTQGARFDYDPQVYA